MMGAGASANKAGRKKMDALLAFGDSDSEEEEEEAPPAKPEPGGKKKKRGQMIPVGSEFHHCSDSSVAEVRVPLLCRLRRRRRWKRSRPGTS